MEDPSHLWRAGVRLDDLLDGSGGELDADKLSETVTRVATDHPGWRKRPDGVDHDQGKTSKSPVGGSWATLLRSGSRDK